VLKFNPGKMKTKNLLFALFFMIFLTETASPQLTFQKIIGGTGADFGTVISPTTDGGYILVGTTASFGAGGDDIYLIRLDHNGDTLWTRTYGGSDDETGLSVKQTADGGFIISGDSKSFGANGKDVYLVKTDPLGNPVWSKLFGSSGNDYGNSVLQTSDGGYLVAGSSSDLGAGNYDAYFIRTDANGGMLWTKTYGGPLEDDGNFVQQTSDGGFVLVGTTASYGAGGYDAYVVKTNATGGVLWQKTYGGAGDDYGFSIRQTADGGYILNGATNSFGAGGFDCYLLKTDSNGVVAWSKTYGSTNTDLCNGVLQTNDGGYIFVGQSFGFGTASDIYLVKTNDAGDTLWTKIYGGAGYEFESCILQTSDGGYLISGGEESFGTSRNIYLVKTDSNGNSGCHQGNTTTLVNTVTMVAASADFSVSSGGTAATPATLTSRGGTVTTLCTSLGINEIAGDHSLQIYPNPFSDYFIIKGTRQKGEAIVSDITGKEILRQGTSEGETKILTQNLLPGLYIVSYREENKTVNLKLSKF
jgi:hypothetical protein